MIEVSTCESLEPLTTLDLPYVPVHAIEPESPPASVTEPESSSISASVAHNFLRFLQV